MSLHADALDVLAGWVAPDPGQEALRERYVAHLRAHPDGLERGCRPDHVTASTVVLDASQQQVLLTLHAKAHRWFQLGGHCEPGDATLAGAALREATEESGLVGLRLDPLPVHLDEHEVAFCRGGRDEARPTHHLDVRFVAVAPTGAGHVLSEESLDLAWWPLDALPEGADDLGALLRRARERAAAAAGAPGQSTVPSAPGPAPGSTSSGGGSTWAAADQPSR